MGSFNLETWHRFGPPWYPSSLLAWCISDSKFTARVFPKCQWQIAFDALLTSVFWCLQVHTILLLVAYVLYDFYASCSIQSDPSFWWSCDVESSLEGLSTCVIPEQCYDLLLEGHTISTTQGDMNNKNMWFTYHLLVENTTRRGWISLITYWFTYHLSLILAGGLELYFSISWE